MAEYFGKWPNTLESIRPFVQALIFSYFELCYHHLKAGFLDDEVTPTPIQSLL